MSSTLNLDDSTVKKRIAKVVIDRADELRTKGPHYHWRTTEKGDKIYEHDGYKLTIKKSNTEGGSIVEYFELEGQKPSGEYVRLFVAERASTNGSRKFNILPNVFINPFIIWSDEVANLSKFIDVTKEVCLSA